MTMIPLGDARNHLSEVIDEVERTHDRITITRHGLPVAVMLSPDDLASMEETLEILAIPGALEAIRTSGDQIAAGDVENWDDLRNEFRTDLR